MTKANPRAGKTWPAYVLGGRLRTSTVALIIAFIGVGWLNETYEPPPAHDQVPASEVVPPGFIPDPDYTWVPRTDVQRPETAVTTPATPTTSETATTSPGPDQSDTDTPTTSEQPTPTSGAPTASTSAAPSPSSAAPTTPSASGTAPGRPSASASSAAPVPSPNA